MDNLRDPRRPPKLSRFPWLSVLRIDRRPRRTLAFACENAEEGRSTRRCHVHVCVVEDLAAIAARARQSTAAADLALCRWGRSNRRLARAFVLAFACDDAEGDRNSRRFALECL